MTSFKILIIVLVSAATFPEALCGCSYENCIAPTGSGSTYCGLARSYVECLRENVVNNDDCNFLVQNTVSALLDEVEETMEDFGCSASDNDNDEEDDCSYSNCIVPSGTGSATYCGLAQSYVDCLDENVVNNDDCSTLVKLSVKGLLEGVEKVMDEVGCDSGSDESDDSINFDDDDEDDDGDDEDCSIASCDPPTAVGSEYCGEAREYVDCLQKNVVDNDKCESYYRDTVNDTVGTTMETLDDTGCDGASGLIGSIGLSLGLSILTYMYSNSA